MKAARQISTAAFLLFFFQVANASAVTITTTFSGGVAPANAAGGGNLMDIVEAAARIWASAYSDQATIHLYVGWGPVGEAGTHSILEQGGTPSREIVGIIQFDNSGSTEFFLDPTPDANEEYHRRTEEYQELGGGFVNVARLFSSASGDAAGRTDLLSVALHEIGHALGMSIGNAAFAADVRQGTIVIAGDLPFAGTVVPLASNNAGFTSHFHPTDVVYGPVMSGVGSGERRLPSALDILANAEISGFSLVNFNLTPSRASSRGSALYQPRN